MKRPSATAVLGTTAALLLAVPLSLAVVPAPQLYGFPLTEDGYYALTVARHLGNGAGFTIDGVHLTGGVQPLWVLALAPLSAAVGGDRESLVRLTLLVHWLLYAATAALVGLVAARLANGAGARATLAAAVAAVLYASCGAAYEHHFNGLETGALLAAYAATAAFLPFLQWTTPRTAVWVGAWCGLLILLRVDAVFFAVLLVPCTVRPSEAGGVRRWLQAATVVAAVAGAVAAPWFIFNFLAFGTAMPSGALAQASRGFSPGNVLVMALYAAGRLLPLPIDVVWPAKYEWWAVVLWALTTAAALLHPQGRRALRTLVTNRSARPIILIALHVGALVLWYGSTSRAWWMYSRYAAPALIAGTPLLAVGVARFGERWPRATVATVAALALSGTVAARYLSVTAGVRERPHVLQVELARRYVPDGALIGGLQTGTLGFFRDRVVNLDGKVNAEALQHQRDLLEYCDKRGVEWLIDWPHLLQPVLRGPAAEKWAPAAQWRVAGCASCQFDVLRRIR